MKKSVNVSVDKKPIVKPKIGAPNKLTKKPFLVQTSASTQFDHVIYLSLKDGVVE